MTHYPVWKLVLKTATGACLISLGACGSDDAAQTSALHLHSEQLSAFQMVERVERSQSVFASYKSVATPERVLHVELFSGVDELGAMSRTQLGIMQLEAAYANAVSPYPGQVTKQIGGDRSLKPKRLMRSVGDHDFTYYRLFASGRFTYGTSAKDSIRYQSLMSWLYCPAQERFYTLKYFAPLGTEWQDLEGFMFSLRCAE